MSRILSNPRSFRLIFVLSIFFFSCSLFSIIDNHGDPEIAMKIQGVKISIVQGDITRQVDLEYQDAIVNPANQNLRRGGGVCGAIFAKAGLKLTFECNKLLKSFKDNKVSVGNSVITSGCLFDSRIIHVVPPNFNPNNVMQPSISFDKTGKEILEKSYVSLLRLANKENIKKVAVPFLSGGNFCRVPSDRSELASIALESVIDFCKHEVKDGSLQEIRFVLYSDEEYNLFINEFYHYNN